MGITIQSHPSTPLSRRQVLRLAISSVLLIAGCTTMSNSSDLDTAVSELNDLLNEASIDGESTLLVSIANKIEISAR